MTTLTVGLEVSQSLTPICIRLSCLKDIYPKCNPEWDEDACSDVSEVSLTPLMDGTYSL
jgi:hypothetical protein